MERSSPAERIAESRVGLGQLGRGDLAGLVALTLAGLALRIAYQWGRAFVGDEAGTLIIVSMGYGEILTTFRDPWLSMNLYLALEKLLSGSPVLTDWALVAPGLAAGVALIPLTAALALRFTTSRAALIAAALVAGNPFLVFYSVQIRSYILLVTFSIAALVYFVDWTRDERARDARRCAVFGTLAVLMHVNGVYFGLFLGALFAIWLFDEGPPTAKRWRRALGILGPVTVGAAVAGLAYAPVFEQMVRFSGKWSDLPPSSLSYVPAVFARYFGEGWMGLPSLAALAVGLWIANDRNRPLALMFLGVAVPITALSWIGFVHFPWVHARYLVTAIPILAVFLAVGLSGVTQRMRPAWAVAATAVLLASWTPELHSMFEDKRDFPWRTVGAYLEHNLRPGDSIVTTDVGQLYPHVTLMPMLSDQGRAFRTVGAFLAGAKRGPGRLFVVNPHFRIESQIDHTAFGSVQILIYDDTPRSAAAEKLLGDLRRSVGDSVAAELTGHYKLIGELLAKLHPDSPMRALYDSGFYKSLMRTDRMRNTPISRTFGSETE